MGIKYIDNSWDFRNGNTKEFTHCYHSYPAMMIPQVARRLIEKYGQNAQLLFDPYCGTGTSLVEANLNNINAKEFFESNGFEHIETIIRNIPNKRMPSENSPSNIKGQKATTMKNEYIVICRKAAALSINDFNKKGIPYEG